MNMRIFNQDWEVEYLCERVRRISRDVESGRYESALDYLSMIREKADTAIFQIRAAKSLERKGS